jgi:hypothetical protein
MILGRKRTAEKYVSIVLTKCSLGRWFPSESVDRLSLLPIDGLSEDHARVVISFYRTTRKGKTSSRSRVRSDCVLFVSSRVRAIRVNTKTTRARATTDVELSTTCPLAFRTSLDDTAVNNNGCRLEGLLTVRTFGGGSTE